MCRAEWGPLVVLVAAIAAVVALAPGEPLALGLLVLHGAGTLLALRAGRGSAAQAALDPLTGVANRRGFEARRERARAPMGVVLLDLDGFKAVNDEQGHLRGDALLRDAAEALRRVAAPADLVARPGGDEFAVLVADPARTADVARQVRPALAAAGLSASVGWADDGDLAVADARQRAAKGARRQAAVG